MELSNQKKILIKAVRSGVRKKTPTTNQSRRKESKVFRVN